MTDPATEAKRAEPNRLAGETSPYLLQHAWNPVDWFPWGEEAIQRSRELGRPIFLSIGYSACHWCHVMEHESFENDTIAGLMNERFVNIKVDREERPDLDQIYMNAVMAMTGRGGWPMSVFLTPDLKPFFGGTYWPPVSRMGMPGFADILEKVDEAWKQRPDDVARGADELTAAVRQMGAAQTGRRQLGESLLENSMQALLRAADRSAGGFGQAPKFPHAMDLRMLLRAWKRFGNADALEVVKLTLDKMAGGGIYDHLGGGFHRYSTDARWLVPHFEKMLYDNALLVPVYLEAFQATGEERYRKVVTETLDYIIREMTQPEGGFYATQDADSEGVEGKFFVWSEAEIIEQLGPEDARLFSYCYDVTPHGNWEGANILNRFKTHAEAATMLKVSAAELAQVLDRCKAKLFAARATRVHPGRDDKVLASWNGLTIAAMAQAAQVLDEPKYAQTAQAAADFILKTMQTDDGRLLHGYKDGQAKLNAYLDDYACLIEGLVELYQATFEVRHLQTALELSRRMMADFFDEQSGGFFYTATGHESLIARNVDTQDTATPSGNAMAATALLKLARLCSRTELEDTAVKTLELLSGQMAETPMASGQALIAADFLIGPSVEIALVDGNDPQETQSLLRSLHSRFLPNKVVAHKSAGTEHDDIEGTLRDLMQGKESVDGLATVYLCEHGSCHAPVVGVEGLEAALWGSLQE